MVKEQERAVKESNSAIEKCFATMFAIDASKDSAANKSSRKQGVKAEARHRHSSHARESFGSEVRVVEHVYLFIDLV